MLVDGSALIFRAFFAIPSSFESSAGIPTNATYGFALMFRRILAGRTPKYGAVIFDAPGKTFRDKKYPKYKSHRPPMQYELRQQVPWIKKVVEAHDFPTLTIEGYEADDVIGTYTRLAVEAGHEVYIVSGDKDFAQLIGPRVRMLDTMKDVTYDAELVRKKWGVPPELFVDYLALIGDKVDNIPGIPGVGPKTAKKLLEAYSDLEGVLSNTDKLKGKQKERVENHADDARLSKELATIDQEVPMDVLGKELEDLIIPPVDSSKVDALYRELEFFSLLSGSDATEHANDGDFEALTNEDAKAYFEALGADGSAVAIMPLHDTDSPIHGQVVGVAFSSVADEGKVARYAAVAGEGALDDASLSAMRAWAADPSRPKVTQDLGDVLTVLLRIECPLDGVVGDTRVSSFLIDPTRDIPHRLDQVARRFLHRALIPIKDVVGSGKEQRKLVDVPLADVVPYACHLAAAVGEAWPQVFEKLEEEGQTRFLREVSMPLSRVLAGMQLDGIRADPNVFVELGKEFGARKAVVEKTIHEHAGREFNIGSPKQLGKVLFDELKLPVIKRTKTGYSTAADVLERLAPKHDIAREILQWRSLAKLINTYTQVLHDAIHPSTGRIHCNFQQTVGVSGRLITTDPDLQRTPIRTDDGKRIREAFIAREGWVVISADWSQIELRVLAHICEDPLLLEAFQKKIDVHRRTASQIYEIEPEDVNAEQRNVGKTVNFATIYGQGPVALGQSLGMPSADARDLIDKYFEAYAGVSEWLEEAVTDAYQHGYVETLLGRRRYIPELSSNNSNDRAYGERIATNTPIQGSAADICKLAMLDISKRLREGGHEAKMLLQIHDELVFEAPPSELDAVLDLVRDAMENALPDLSVPLVVDIGHGESWAAAH